jgi:hypothetical protein
MMKTLFSLLTAASLVTATAASGAFELTMDNYESTVSGKNAFVKFLAPW